MQSICCKLSRMAAVVVMLVVACVGSAWGATGYKGGVPWQTGDIVVCFGTSGGFGGACNVLRIVGGNPILLDQFTDNLGGSTFGVAINNSLHVVATDTSGGSKVVVYSVGSLDVTVSPPTPIAHTPVYTYDSRGIGGTGSNPTAVAFNKAGNIFVLNSTGSNIVELGPGPQPASPIATIPLCASITQATSMDLSGDGNSAYITSGGTIWKVAIPGGGCTKFADFGAKANLYGIKDIPAGALASVTPNCNGATCPGDETLLVVANGTTDPDASTGENENPDTDAVNICTNSTAAASVSCALLLDTNPNPGLTASLWQAGHPYFSMGSPILDPFLRLQTVLTPGTSGSDEPPFNDASVQTTIDNAVKWTDIVQPVWQPTHAYAVIGTAPAPSTAAVADTYFVDPNGHLETVTGTGISGPVEPGTAASPSNPSFWSTSGGTTIDGLQWQDQGFWQANTLFAVGAPAGDASGHVHSVLTAGKSGGGVVPTGTAALPGWNDTGTDTNGGLTAAGVTIDNAVIWTNEGALLNYTGGHQYAMSQYTAPNGHIQQAVEPGTSGNTSPAFSTSGGRTIDNAVTWADLGPAMWHPSFNYGQNAIIVDGSGNVQQVTTAGTSGPGPQPSFSTSPTTDGLQWSLVTPGPNPSTLPDWQPNTQYCSTCAAGMSFQDTATTDVWQATTPGTSGSTRPTFYVGGNPAPQPVVDDAVVWTSQGPVSGFAWKADHAYSLNAPIVEANHVQIAAVAGTSGPSQPTFSNGDITNDNNSVTWTNLGFAVWRPSFSYGLNAIIVDPIGHVQQVTSAGTSGASQPTFNDSNSTTSDNQVTWTDRGLLAGNATFTWQASTGYSLNAMIVDPANQIELATTPGTSGGSTPTFADGGNIVDGLVWVDLGPVLTWAPGISYTATNSFPFTLVSGSSFVQQATTSGVSGTPSQPNWNATVGGSTVDGLQWTDQGRSVWAGGHLYSIGDPFISETTAPYTVQKVYESGTSGSGLNPPAFNHTVGGRTPDNSVTWTESNPNPPRVATTAYVVGAIVVDSVRQVQQVTLNGTTGPNGVTFSDTATTTTPGGTVVDGLQWTNAPNPTTSVVARYPVGSTTLQSLALDPLIVDCTAGCNYPLPPLQVSSAITSPGPSPTLAAPGFWLGDNQYANVWKVDFASGTPVMIPVGAPPIDTNNTPCSTCASVGGIQGIGIYGSESANQPGLAKLLFNNNAAPSNTPTAYFPSSGANSTYALNSLALTLYNGASPANSLLPFAVYASVVAPNSCFDDFTGNPYCLGTFQPGGTGTVFPIMWKMDVPLPSSGNLALSSTQTLVGNFDFPIRFQSFSNDVTLDSNFDVTTLVGLDSPIYRSPSTSHGSQLKSANGQPENDYKCTYNSPVISPSKNCYANPGTIPVKFSCNNLGGNSLQNYGVTNATPWGPTLQIVEFGPPPIPTLPFGSSPAAGALCDGTANTGSAPSQANANHLSSTAPILAPGGCETAQLPSSNGATTYSSKNGSWTYNWKVQSTAAGVVYQICTYDDSSGSWDKTSGRKGTPFCTLPFYVKNSCP